MGKRQRRRRREGVPGSEPAVASSTPYADREGNVLTLRDKLSAGTLHELGRLDAAAGASAEDRSQRRVELLFERLAVRWELAGLPLEGQRELLGRYRMAGVEERRWVRQTLARHLRDRYPEIELPL